MKQILRGLGDALLCIFVASILFFAAIFVLWVLYGCQLPYRQFLENWAHAANPSLMVAYGTWCLMGLFRR